MFASVGLDVHARSVVAAAIDGRSDEVFRARLTPSHAEVIEWVGKLPSPCAVAYDAGPTGFGLARALSAAGLRREVAASSKLLRPAGDRMKTDARDALDFGGVVAVGRGCAGAHSECGRGGCPGICSAPARPPERI
ncbi:hypothetical protein [Mycobacterium sp. URHB0021]